MNVSSRIGPSMISATSSGDGGGSGHHRSSSASVDLDELNEETRYRFNDAAATAAKAVRTMSAYRFIIFIIVV